MAGWKTTPPEIQAQILQFLIEAVGVDRAWRKRGVDREFTRIIQDTILGTQPVHAFVDATNSHLTKLLTRDLSPAWRFSPNLPPLMGQFLYQKVKNGRKDDHPIPLYDIIKQCVTYLHPVDPEEPEWNLDAERLCNALAFCSPASYVQEELRSYHNPPLDPQSLHCTRQDKLVAAVLVNASAVVESLIEKGATLWNMDSMFGHCVGAAALNYPELPALPLVLSHFPSGITKQHRHIKMIWNALDDALHQSFQRQRYESVKLLIRYYSGHVPLRQVSDWNEYLEKAIESRNVDMMNAVHGVQGWKGLQNNDASWEHFLLVLLMNYEDGLEFLIGSSNLGVDRIYHRTSMLNEAAKAGNIDFVDMILANDADPDGPRITYSLRQLQSPLQSVLTSETAARRGSLSTIVRTLLDNGATYHGHSRGNGDDMSQAIMAAYSKGWIEASLVVRLRDMKEEEDKEMFL